MSDSLVIQFDENNASNKNSPLFKMSLTVTKWVGGPMSTEQRDQNILFYKVIFNGHL